MMNPQMMQMLMAMGQGQQRPGMMPGVAQHNVAPGTPGGVDMAPPETMGLGNAQALGQALDQQPVQQPGGYLSALMKPGAAGGGMADPRIMGLLGMMQGMGQQGQQAPQMQMGPMAMGQGNPGAAQWGPQWQQPWRRG